MIKLIERRMDTLNETEQERDFILYGYDQLSEYLRSIGEYFECIITTYYSGWSLKKDEDDYDYRNEDNRKLTVDELISILKDKYGRINKFYAYPDTKTVEAKKRIKNPDYEKYPDETRTETHNILIKRFKWFEDLRSRLRNKE